MHSVCVLVYTAFCNLLTSGSFVFPISDLSFKKVPWNKVWGAMGKIIEQRQKQCTNQIKKQI